VFRKKEGHGERKGRCAAGYATKPLKPTVRGGALQAAEEGGESVVPVRRKGREGGRGNRLAPSSIPRVNGKAGGGEREKGSRLPVEGKVGIILRSSGQGRTLKQRGEHPPPSYRPRIEVRLKVKSAEV